MGWGREMGLEKEMGLVRESDWRMEAADALWEGHTLL